MDDYYAVPMTRYLHRLPSGRVFRRPLKVTARLVDFWYAEIEGFPASEYLFLDGRGGTAKDAVEDLGYVIDNRIKAWYEFGIPPEDEPLYRLLKQRIKR